MNKTKNRSFVAILTTLVCFLVLVLSLGIFCACGNESADQNESESAGGSWYTGTSAPAAELGNNGDYYLNTATLTAYAKSADGAWQTTTLYSGTEAPDASNGEQGDLYLDTKDGVLYQKGESLWSIVLTLKGTPGRDGVVWFSGEKDPEVGDSAIKDAHVGDFYLNTTEFTVWQLQAGGWASLGGLTGAQGATGPAGPAGPTGAQGPAGSTGSAGKDGTDGKSAYELYVEQYIKDKGSEDGVLSEKEWLESLKGEQGEPGKDSVHFFYGEGEPDTAKPEGVKEGDLYFGQFYGMDGTGTAAVSGSRLYRYHNGKWDVIMESMTKGQVNIDSIEKLEEFRALVAAGNTFEGTEVHLKADIDFNGAEGTSLHRAAARIAAWTPIGTETHPFKGTFDGEGHTIKNFSTETSDDAKVVGFFGYVEGAVIQNLHFENATVTATGADAVGAVVVGESKGDVTLNNVTVSGGTVTAEESGSVGSLVGKNNGGTVKAKDVEVSVSGIENTKDNFVGSGDVTMEGDYAMGETVSEGFVKKTEYGSDGVSKGTVYEIKSLDGLKAFRDSVNNEKKNYEGETVVLDTDIELKDEKTWTPIGNSSTRFLGNFDGQNHTVSNLKIINNSKINVFNWGFFGAVGNYTLTQGNSIKNLTIENIEMPAAETPTEKNPHGKTDTFSNVGAFIGSAQLVNLENLTLKGDVYIAGQSNIGGIVGEYSLGAPSADKVKEISTTIRNITVDTTGTISANGKGCGAVIGSLKRFMFTDGGGYKRNMDMSTIVVTGVTLKGAGEVGGIAGGGTYLEKVNITIDGATLTNVKILSAGLKSEVDTFGALISYEGRRDPLASYMNTLSTFIFKNISGDVSIAKASETEQYQAKQLNKGLIGALDTVFPPTISDNENVTLQITWYGELIGAE